MSWSWSVEYTQFHVELDLVEHKVKFSTGDFIPGVPAYAQGGGGDDIAFADFVMQRDSGLNPISAPPDILNEITDRVRQLHRVDSVLASIQEDDISVPRQELQNIRRMLSARDPAMVKKAISRVECLRETDPAWSRQVIQSLSVLFGSIKSPDWLLQCTHQYAILIWWLGLQASLGTPYTEKSLRISGRPLDFIHPNIGYLNQLELLYFHLDSRSKDFLPTTLPDTIGKLQHLKTMGMVCRDLECIPSQLGDLPALQILELRSKSITEFPAAILRLSNLEKLTLDNTQCTTIPPGIAALTRLTYLQMRIGALSGVSPELGQLTNLNELNLSDNAIQELPESLGNLHQLQELNLRCNRLTTLPSTLGQCPLTELQVSGNPLETLPDGLTALSIDKDQWQRLSAQVLNMTTLQSLRVEYSDEIPREIGKLTNLRRLLLSRSSAMEIPDSIGELTQLEELDLSNINAETLPESMQQLTNLKRVWLYRARERFEPTLRRWFPDIEIK